MGQQFGPPGTHEASVTSSLTWLLGFSKLKLGWICLPWGHDPSIIFHTFKTSRHSMTWINRVMQKHHGGPFALDHGECSPSGEDGEAIEIAMEGTPWKSHTIIFWDSELSHYLILSILRFVCPQISKLPLCPCLHKVPSDRDTKICHAKWLDQGQEHATQVRVPEDAREGCQCSPGQGRVKWASFEGFHVLFAHTALQVLRFFHGSGTRTSTCSLSIVDSDIQTSPLFGEGMIMNDVVSELAA